MKNINYDKLPEHIRGGMRRYIEYGVIPGSFLQSVICNNLKGAFLNADPINIDRLKDIVEFMYIEAPGNCWGSLDIMNNWSKKREQLVNRGDDDD